VGEYIPSCRVGFEMGNELLFAIEGSVDGDAMLSTRIEGAWIESFDEDSFAGRIAAKEAPSSLYSSPRRMVGSPKTTASAVTEATTPPMAMNVVRFLSFGRFGIDWSIFRLR